MAGHAHVAFIDDVAHITRLDKQRFLLLRPRGEVATIFHAMQAQFRARFPASEISYPAQPHVTIHGFPAGSSVEQTTHLAREWARETPPLRIAIERASSFGLPFKIAIVQIRKTNALTQSMQRARKIAQASELPQFPDGAVPTVEQWIFHLSVAYCSHIPDAVWHDARALADGLSLPAAVYVATEAELIAFDGGQEHLVGVFSLSGTASKETSWN